MFNRTLINYKFPYKILYLAKYDNVLTRQFKTLARCPVYPYQRLDYLDHRVHSTQSDSHRQKVVIETTVPKIVVEKKKLNFFDAVEPYVKLARWDRPIGVYLLYWPCAWSLALGALPGTAPPHATLHAALLFY